MNLSGYSKKFGEGADAGPVGQIIERTRAYLQETGLRENVVYVDEPNMEVYVTTAFGMFVVSSDEERRYVARLTPWQDISGCSLTIGPTPESTRGITVTIKALEATLTERVGDSASPLIVLFHECVKRSRPW